MTKLIFNDIPFLIGWKNEQMGKEGVSQFINVLLNMSRRVSGLILECDSRFYYTYRICNKPIFVFILDVFKDIKSEDEASFKTEKGYLIAKLNKPHMITVEEMGDTEFKYEDLYSSICSYAYRMERHLITIKNQDALNDSHLIGYINSDKVHIKNITSINHLDNHSDSLGIRKFVPSPKHEERGWGTILDISTKTVDNLLVHAIPKKDDDYTCLINYYNYKVYMFRITTDYVYHAYPEERANYVDEYLSRLKKFGTIVNGCFVP